jgi:two-component system, OmpR family, response regulator
MRILIVEDDSALRLGIRRILQAEGWHVDAAENGEQALIATQEANYAVAVLDLGLPRMDGLAVLKVWREQGLGMPVVILTARDELSDRVTGLNAGADDYMAKPFEPEELVARLRALMRRNPQMLTTSLSLGELNYDPQDRSLRIAGQPVGLSSREAALMELLMAQPDKAVAKSRIVSSMSDWESEFSSNSVEIYIMRLRRKIAGSGAQIRTVRGVGYKICADSDGLAESDA